ncbi:hypothetical protein KGQ25_03115 [Patescibacteria group bacterium]|nr:hypothetical protein [Patescibacteria group bacterium]
MDSIDKEISFSRELLKGKIAEVIFEQMFRDCGKFTILPFGYEKTVPEVAQYQHIVEVKQVLDNIRHAPDFIIITQDRSQVYLVEVKYRSNSSASEIKAIAEQVREHWNVAWLFLATPEGFFFDPINRVIASGGKIAPLSNSWIDSDTQTHYLSLLMEFEKKR